MHNPLSAITKTSMPRFLAQMRRNIVGIAQDYWKDGNWEKPVIQEDTLQDGASFASVSAQAQNALSASQENLWHAQAGEISEKMWGDGYVTPGDEAITTMLMTPLGVTKDMSILDLSAGLGGRLRKASADYGVYITGMEPDRAVAERGMALSMASGMGKKASIESYDPMNMKATRKYDCVLARETIYRVTDKEKFITSIVTYCKLKAQVSFTDYVVNNEMREEPAIVAWRAFEQGADPCSLVEMAEMWAKAGISIRVHDDQTAFYKKEIKKGLIHLTQFLASGVKPDAETKAAINKRIATWAHRMAAMDAGMRFYRFYGLR